MVAGAYLVPLTLTLSQGERGQNPGRLSDNRNIQTTMIPLGYALARARRPLFFLDWLCSAKYKEP
jgi:hypothetical protein